MGCCVWQKDLSGSMSSPIINCGMSDFLDAISMAAFSKELKGLSRMMQLTFLCGLAPWLRMIDTEPIDLPHKMYS